MSAAAVEGAIDPPEGLLAEHADRHRPIAGYAALILAFNGAVGTALAVASRRNQLPDRPHAGDLALCGVATYKLSRVIGRDRVTAALRAPFTRFQDDAGHGEVDEAARGRGLRRAVGELLVCPDCLGQWVAGGFSAGLWFAPRQTRAVAGMFTIYAVSDALQLLTSAAQKRA